MLPYADDFDANSIHVQSGTAVIFLCGGPTSNISEGIPRSLRDAFLKIVDYGPLKGRDVIQAEDVTAEFRFFDYYDNILDFEAHLAQIVELIILFCESEGSLAELGAFALIDDIAERLFVVVRRKHWNKDSFVRLGPLRRLERKFDRSLIYVLSDQEVGMKGDDASAVDKNALGLVLRDPLIKRLAIKKEPTTYNRARPGHVIKLIVRLIQEYGALVEGEIMGLLQIFNTELDQKEMNGYLLCAEAVGWLEKVSRGPNDYFIAKKKIDTAVIRVKETAEHKNKDRRRVYIREYWKNNDRERYNGIIEVFGSGAR